MVLQLLDRTVAEFQSLFRNAPGALIEGGLATGGRIQYQYTVIGCLSILYMHIQEGLGFEDEGLDAIAHVIAEAQCIKNLLVASPQGTDFCV